MTKKTEKALRESIAHWERMATGKREPGEEPGPHNCALCALFIDKLCTDCPVSHFTGRRFCFGTPYDDAMIASRKKRDECGDPDYDAPTFKKVARKELKFLRGLLPKGKV